MKITFLGTSGGKPTKERNCSAITLECANEKGWYLFDCAEGTQRQILQSHLSALGIKAIFITHIHGDHCYGLPGLLTSMMLDNRSAPLQIFAPKLLRQMFETSVDMSFEHLGYEIEWIELYGGFQIEFEHFRLKALPLIHSVESFAFYIQTFPKINIDASKLSSQGLPPGPLYAKLKAGIPVTYGTKTFLPKDFVTQREPQRLIIAGDNAEPEILGKYLQNLDLLIHEATYTQETFENLTKRLLHTSAKLLAQTSQKFNIKHLIATHISPRYSDSGVILKELQTFYHNPCWVAKDFDSFFLEEESLKGPF